MNATVFNRAKIWSAESLSLSLHNLRTLEVALEGRHALAAKSLREELLKLSALPRQIEAQLSEIVPKRDELDALEDAALAYERQQKSAAPSLSVSSNQHITKENARG